jgi:hypothetical protein
MVLTAVTLAASSQALTRLSSRPILKSHKFSKHTLSLS